MKKGLLIGLGIILLCRVAWAHEHWIDLDRCNFTQGEKATISISSGHYFSKSELALSDRLLSDTKIIGPDKKEHVFSTQEGEKSRTSEHSFKTAGTHVITFTLKKPPVDEPLYWAKSIVFVGTDKNDDINLYRTGVGLEIVPGKSLSTIKTGEKLPLRLLYNGEPVASAFSVSVQGKADFSLLTDKAGVAMLKIKKEGKYFITAPYQGMGCSLTFCIRNQDTEL